VLGQNQPGPATTKNQRGDLFSPHPPACRTNVLHAEGNTGNKINEGEGEFTWRGGGGALLVGLRRWWCCGGGRWRCRGSRTAAPSNGAAVSSGGERESSSSPLL